MNTNKFSVLIEKEADAVVVTLQGELDLAAASDFRTLMEPLATDAAVELTLDLGKLTYIDSTGIGIFISILKVRNAANAPFYMVNMPAQIQRLLDMTGITKFLQPHLR